MASVPVGIVRFQTKKLTGAVDDAIAKLKAEVDLAPPAAT